jgi:hypothetical protein
MTDVADTILIGNHKLKMTYGLLTDLQRVVPDAENAIQYILSDTFVRDYLVRRTLTPMKGSVASEDDLILAEDVDLSPEEVTEVLNWVAGHLMLFFARSAKGLRQQGQNLQKMMGLSVPSADGSDVSTSSEPGAGPLTVAAQN